MVFRWRSLVDTGVTSHTPSKPETLRYSISLLSFQRWKFSFNKVVNHFTRVAALWTMECLTASLSMSLEYPPPITVATGTPFLTTVCITYRSLRYSPGVQKKFRNVDEWRLMSITGSPSSVRQSLPSSSSRWGSTPASYSTRSGRKVSSSQGRWASTVDHPTCQWVQGPLVTLECKLNKKIAYIILTCLWRGTPHPPVHHPRWCLDHSVVYGGGNFSHNALRK